MSAEENKALIRRFFEEIDKGNIEVLDELVAENFIDHVQPSLPVPPGREGLKMAFKMLWDATPGYHQIEDMIAEGDKVVTRLTGHGTHTGSTPGIAPTGNELTLSAIVIHRIANGKIVEHWAEKDMSAFMRQLGVTSTSAQSSRAAP
ncbi:ester cyclase [Ktedonosporobacter rubrisoli]|uniref:Ester cyclase n=1 Tax=Ktedonosporobacter rubrisoli TaxID=2509675 RepID=A0A4V0Z0N1_KTERU|nr:ester cyclase [Ktedonosporobacter rubrisoli]